LLNPAYTGSTAKYIKRELAQAIPLEYYWVLEEGGDEKLRSSISKCPMDADKWGTPSDWDSSGGYPGEYIRPDDTARTAGFPELEIICSKGIKYYLRGNIVTIHIGISLFLYAIFV